MLPEQKLDALIARHHTVEAELSTQVSPDTYVKLSREFAELGPIIETIQAYRGVAAEIDDLNTLIADPATDAEMRTMANLLQYRSATRTARRGKGRDQRAVPRR